MAKAHICDGCNAVIEGDPTTLGFVITGDYCGECAPIVAEYGAAIDALHEECADKWKNGLAKIRIKYAKRVNKLPDVSRG